ncbi:unnamed protein product, partial [Symbiodinium microadriaticum]
VIDEALILSSSCTWHGHPGLQVTLKEPLTFQGNLVLMGEIHIIGEQERDGPCMNVRGQMRVTAARASFVGCRNRLKAGTIWTWIWVASVQTRNPETLNPKPHCKP